MNTTASVLYVKQIRNLAPNISPSKRNIECGLNLLQTVFGASSIECRERRKKYDYGVGMTLTDIIESFDKHNIRDCSFIQITGKDLNKIVKEGYGNIIYLFTKRFYFRYGHYAFVTKRNNVLEVYEPSNSIFTPINVYFKNNGFNENQIGILIGKVIPSPENANVVQIP